MDKEQLAIARLHDAARLSEHRYKKPLMVTYLKECLMPAKQRACRVTGRPAWTFSTGGWKMATSAVS